LTLALAPDGHRARPAQAPAGQAPQRRGAGVGQEDLVCVPRERFANDDPIGPAPREEDEIELHTLVAFDGEPGPCKVLTREVAADLVPEHRPRVAATRRIRLLRDQPNGRHPAAALGELAERGVSAGAGPVHDERMRLFPTGRDGSIVRVRQRSARRTCSGRAASPGRRQLRRARLPSPRRGGRGCGARAPRACGPAPRR
jgi:hypothetical protein